MSEITRTANVKSYNPERLSHTNRATHRCRSHTGLLVLQLSLPDETALIRRDSENLEFGQWNTVINDNGTAGLIDRLVHHGHVLAFTGEVTDYGMLSHSQTRQKT